MSKTTFIAYLVILILILMIFLKESREDLSKNRLKNDAVILAFGDSLTYGFGASDGHGYPEYLERKTGLSVTNAGLNGELSSEGLLRLPKFLEQKPDLVILCHGGNDILQKLSPEQLKNNLLEMVKLSKQSGAEVLLVAVPNFNIVSFKILSIYKEVAKEIGVFLEDDVLTHIELNGALKSDYVHPNEEGYEMMADAFLELLKKKNLLP